MSTKLMRLFRIKFRKLEGRSGFLETWNPGAAVVSCFPGFVCLPISSVINKS
jgi:hypothetical protein